MSANMDIPRLSYEAAELLPQAFCFLSIVSHSLFALITARLFLSSRMGLV